MNSYVQELIKDYDGDNFESGEVKQLYVKINPRNNIPKIILCTKILSLAVINYSIF